MKEPAAPKAVAVEVVAAQPTQANKKLVTQLEADQDKSLPGATYIVKVRLKVVPEATSHGWTLYVDELRIPKYWEYSEGIYFKVFDPQFFVEHKGGKLRFSQNGTDFTDTGLKLAAPKATRKQASRKAARLPSQDDLLKQRERHRDARVRRARQRAG